MRKKSEKKAELFREGYKKRLVSSLFSLVLMLTLTFGLMSGMRLTVLAYEGNPYASLVGSTNTVKSVTFSSETNTFELKSGDSNVTFSAYDGVATNGNEKYDNLFDGDTRTKWCTFGKESPDGQYKKSFYVEFRSDAPITVNKYSLTTANDTDGHGGRNPKSWYLKAKRNSDDDWTTIDTVTDDQVMQAESYKEYSYDVDVIGTWQYFMFLVYETKGEDTLQLSELKLTSSKIKDKATIGFETDAVEKFYGDKPFTVKLNNTGDGEVTYTSDNENVAKVNSSTGEVEILSSYYQPVTITATVEDSDKYQYPVKTAKYSLNIKKHSIYFKETYDPYKVVVYGGESFTNELINDGNAKVTYSSGDDNVLKVDPDTGEVTIVDVGGAAVIATVSEEYVKYYESPTVTYRVYVDRAEPEYEIPTGVTGILGQPLYDVKLPDGWGWRDNGYLNSIGEVSYLAGYVPKDTTRYKEARKYITITVVGADKTELERLMDETFTLYNSISDLDYYGYICDSEDLQKQMEKLFGTLKDINNRLAYDLPISEVNTYEQRLKDYIKETNELLEKIRDEITFNVYFITNGGTSIATQTVHYGKTVTKPANPNKNGFIFKGWFADPELSTPYDFDTPITSEIGIFAKWEKDETQDPGTGGDDPSNKEYNKGSYTLNLKNGKFTSSYVAAITLAYAAYFENSVSWDQMLGEAGSKIDLDNDGNYDITFNNSTDGNAVIYEVLPTNSIEYDVTITFSSSNLETINKMTADPFYEKLVIVFKERPTVTPDTDDQKPDNKPAGQDDGAATKPTQENPGAAQGTDSQNTTPSANQDSDNQTTAKDSDSAGNANGSVTDQNQSVQNADQAQITQDADQVHSSSDDQADVKETVDKKQKNTKVSKLKAGKKSIKITWKKQATKGIKGYEIQYSTNKNFKKNVKNVTINKVKTTSKTIKKLKSGKKYFVRIRTYKKSGTKKVYSNWSKAKSVKVK